MSEVTNSYFCSSTDYFGSDVSEGHYNSVPSAEACQKDCQVDWDCENLDRDVGGDVNFQKKDIFPKCLFWTWYAGYNKDEDEDEDGGCDYDADHYNSVP